MTHRFYPEVAADHGVIAALLFYHIAYWVDKNKKEERNEHVCRYWMYSSIRDLSEKTFYYLTENQIRYGLKKLIGAGLIDTGNFNKTSYDRTRWYTLTDDGWRIKENCEMETANIPVRNQKNN